MLDVCLLGTGGMMPLAQRWLTSLMLRCQGSNLLIDCGEGTQIAMKEKGWSPHPIDVICFTHYHADHISGLPGLLLSMGNSERTEPVHLIGPKGLERVVSALRVIAPELPFELIFHELQGEGGTHRFGPYLIEAFKVNHRVSCYGYRIGIERIGRFDAERAKALGIPVRFWNKLQHGEAVEFEGRQWTPSQVLGEARRGLQVCYCTDTRPLPIIAQMASGVDLFICEGMYGEPDKQDNARAYKHMTMYEAAALGAQAQPREMWLTHYSPSELKPEIYKEEVQKLFSRCLHARDGWSRSLVFDEA